MNVKVGIYQSGRDADHLGLADVSLTGHGGESDPMVLWDPDTQRFYYNILNVSNRRDGLGIQQGRRSHLDPGKLLQLRDQLRLHPPASIPDYPKLGQTKGS